MITCFIKSIHFETLEMLSLSLINYHAMEIFEGVDAQFHTVT
jgi:hypothetical protein